MLLYACVITFMVCVSWSVFCAGRQKEALGSLDLLTQRPELLLQVTKAITAAAAASAARLAGVGGGL